jgi:ribosomal protein S6
LGVVGMVVAEVQRGYKINDRVLRPAMVIVGKGKEKKPPTGEKPHGGEEPPEGDEKASGSEV